MKRTEIEKDFTTQTKINYVDQQNERSSKYTACVLLLLGDIMQKLFENLTHDNQLVMKKTRISEMLRKKKTPEN